MVVDGQERHIGTFEDEREAAEAYDRVVKMMRGADALLNFPGDARLTPITPEALKAERRDERKGSASSRHRGVTWPARDGRWGARIFTRGVQHTLGLYEDEEVAALAYDRAARHFMGAARR